MKKLKSTTLWDVIIIGGGATGLGCALDAASRGYQTLLLEQSDFAKGTSSRSTKLVHGGVRYLAQGRIGLVFEALRERGRLGKNAPHLVVRQAFIIPCYSWWVIIKYWIGLKVYDWLAGSLSFGSSTLFSKSKLIASIPSINQQGLKGGIEYWDGQFDDARLAVNLAQTCAQKGGTLLNYVKVTGLLKTDTGKVQGVIARDMENGQEYSLFSKSVVNATGVFVDEILQMDKASGKKIVCPSQGVHLVFKKSFLNGDKAILIPQTTDQRVLFAIPWKDHLLVGTTDTPLDQLSMEPIALHQEVDFILETIGKYLHPSPNRQDILSVFAGLRPLAAPGNLNSKTKEISRSHQLMVNPSGLMTITGGKWTTYRKMGEDAINKAIQVGELTPYSCSTKILKIHGYRISAVNSHLSVYGSDEEEINQLIRENPELGQQLDERFPYLKAEVIWAVRHEMARTVEDVLARRLRILFLDARAAIDLSAEVGTLMAGELGYDPNWQASQLVSFRALAGRYLQEPADADFRPF
ncbi:MAG: glycerol-3-phosphate dehydrogenase/oxidase [Chitinophagaceae bacterium]